MIYIRTVSLTRVMGNLEFNIQQIITDDVIQSQHPICISNSLILHIFDKLT